MKRRYDHENEELFDKDNGASPILPGRIITDGDLSDSDTEVIITSQANKKRKMSGDDALKLWFAEEIRKQLSGVASKDQITQLVTSVDNNTSLSRANAEMLAKQQNELDNLRVAVSSLGGDLNGPTPQCVPMSSMPSSSYATAAGTSKDNNHPPINPNYSRLITKRPERVENERKEFEKARRSLRVWPIPGKDNQEIRDAFIGFCTDALLLPADSDPGVL